MPIHDLYSKRNKKPIDVFTYDELPVKLKIQVIHIFNNFSKQFSREDNATIWSTIHQTLCEEYGEKELSDASRFFQTKVQHFFEEKADLEQGLDVIQLTLQYFQLIYKHAKRNLTQYSNLNYKPAEAISDLNARFLENGIGYEFKNDKILRIDNSLLHQEVVIPALHFLSEPEFQNANDEYLNAHEHFRHSRTKECLNDCLKALETTLKIICHQNDWIPNKGATAKHLLDLCFQNNFIPSYLANHFGGLRSTLESGVPTLRNKLGGHGQGTDKIEVPMHFASYMLYLTGTTINFLVSCQQDFKKL
ncbi:MAG: STM4504/CBY_0614 family protein [Adhaeribacter sp.]